MKKKSFKKSFLLSPSCFQQELSSSPTCLKEGRKIIIENPSPALPEKEKGDFFPRKVISHPSPSTEASLEKKRKTPQQWKREFFYCSKEGGNLNLVATSLAIAKAIQ